MRKKSDFEKSEERLKFYEMDGAVSRHLGQCLHIGFSAALNSAIPKTRPWSARPFLYQFE
jgi:hypothetical protein